MKKNDKQSKAGGSTPAPDNAAANKTTREALRAEIRAVVLEVLAERDAANPLHR
jgi:hypothetical protein